MKLRQIRKRTQRRIKHNRAWDWSFERLIRGVCAAYKKFDEQAQAVWMKAVWGVQP